MGASQPLLRIPDRLRELVERQRRRGLRQSAVPVVQQRWIPRLGAYADVIAGLPDELDRDAVRELVLTGSSDAAATIAGFIATQIWGYGTTGYGPARLAAALSDQGLPGILQTARSRLESMDPVGAFRALCVEHRIPKTGAAFGSKYLYFADPHRQALILDQIVRDWLERHASVRLSGGRDEREYAVWLLLAAQWASALRVPADKLEMIIFTDGLPEASSWRPAQPTSLPVARTSRPAITCADAIACVLEGAGDGLRAADIAREINLRGLYRRQDGTPLPAYQVSSIAHANRGRFRIVDGVLRLPTASEDTSGARHRGGSPPTVPPPNATATAPSMSKVILLGCVKGKLDKQAAAQDLYTSRLWNSRRAYAEASGQPWLILSAKHGLLDPDAIIAPYNVDLRKLRTAEQRKWGALAVHELQRRFGALNGMTFEVHAGAAYRQAIHAGLTELGANMEAPLAHLPIGKQPAWYTSHQATRVSPGASARRQQHATSREVEKALAALVRPASQVAGRDWPGALRDLDQPGLYSWSVDGPGAQVLAQELGHHLAPGRIYAGQTGATKWPSGKTGTMTLAKRISGHHLRGRIRGSTFRLTLASLLRKPLELTILGPKQLDRASEDRLSDWIALHLEVAVHAWPERDALADLEHQVLAVLDPPLNIDGTPTTPIRTALSRLRATLAPES